MSKKLILSLSIIGIVSAIVIGGTVAYFSNTATMSGNTFTAGTMDIKIDQDVSGATQDWVDGFDTTSYDFRAANGWTGDGYSEYTAFMKASGLKDLYPGVTKKQIMDIKNVGTVDGVATIKFDIVSNTGVNDWGALADNLNFVVTYDKNNDGGFETAVDSGSLSTWDGNTYDLGALLADQIASVKIVWSVPTSAENEIQGAGIGVNTTFGLNQVVSQ